MSRAAATQSWVGLNPGHGGCYWSFNERRRVVRRRGVSRALVCTWRRIWPASSGSPARSDRTHRTPAQSVWEADGRNHAASLARTSERHQAKTPSWRPHPLRNEDAHSDQDPGSTLRTAHRRRIGGGRSWRWGEGRWLGGNRRDGQERTGLITLTAAGRTPDPVVPHLRTPARQDMLEEALEKRQAREGHPAELLGPIVPIAEGDLPAPRLRTTRPRSLKLQ